MHSTGQTYIAGKFLLTNDHKAKIKLFKKRQESTPRGFEWNYFEKWDTPNRSQFTTIWDIFLLNAKLMTKLNIILCRP